MRLTNRIRGVLCVIAGGMLAACGAPGDSSEDFGSIQQLVAPPAGANAAYVSNTLPGTWAPSERRVVTVTMNNNGTTTWTPTAPVYALRTLDAGAWGWAYTSVPSNVAPAANYTFSFVAEAPASAVLTTKPFSARMGTLTSDNFGAVAGPFTQTIDPAATPMWGCQLTADDVPATLTPGERRVINLTLKNVGSATWPATGMYVESKDTPSTLWVQSRNALPAATVAPGASAVATFTITAPSTPGTYAFTREMMQSNGVGLFRTRVPYCVTKSIVVGGTNPLGATFVNNAPFPTTMAAGDVATVTVTMTNSGTESWLTGGNYGLYSQSSPSNLWGVTSSPVTVQTNGGGNATFTFNITAPATPGSYAQRWQMRKLNGTSAGYFGDLINIPVTVTAGTPSYSSTVTSQTIPTLITAGTTANFSITMQNSGITAWTGSSFQLYSANTPVNLWTTLATPLGAAETVAAGASRVFNFSVQAPSTAGIYSSSWRLRQSPGVGFFGATALTSNIEVTLCGNGTIDAGEACDDSNLVNGDDCSQLCQFEQTVVDLASATPARGLKGNVANGQLAAVTVGDVTGDNVPEVFASQYWSPTGVTPTRAGAGAVYGFANAGFFTNSITTMPTGAGIQISGAAANDALGLVASGRIVIGDVTGDGTGDLILSAPNANGGTGAVYVLAGGSGLMTTGLVDLGAMTPHAALTVRIVGAAGDLLKVLTAADVTGDGTADLVLGAPGNATGGTNAGMIYIVPGPISAATTLAGAFTIPGTTAEQKLGGSPVAVGDIGGSASADLLIGVPLAAPGGLLRQGAAYAFFGPIAGNKTIAAADVSWIGPGLYVGLGTNVAIGNVTGTAANEALISGVQLLKSGTQVGGVTVWSGVVAGTYDMSAAATPNTTILGIDANDDCGTSLALGRLNADTYDDIVFACSTADGPTNALSGAGEVHVVKGAATLPATWNLSTRPSALVVYGATAGEQLGRYGVALSLGNINGDTKADFCAGSYFGGGASPSKPGAIACIASPL